MEKIKRRFLARLTSSLLAFMLLAFGVVLLNFAAGVQLAKAWAPSSFLNSVSLTLQNDLNGNNIVNIGDTIRIEADLDNPDNQINLDCTTSPQPTVQVNLSSYGGTPAEALSLFTCNNGTDDIWQLDFVVANAGLAGLEVPGNDIASLVTVSATGSLPLDSNYMAEAVDNNAPTIVSAETYDSDANGKIDRMKVVYSEAVDDPDYNAVSLAGHVVNGGLGTGTTIFYYDYSEGAIPDTDATPALTWTAANAADLSGNDLDLTGAPANPDDKASPLGTTTVSLATLNDTNLVQTVTVSYSEPMNTLSTPTITFTNNVGAMTSNLDGSWTDSQTWTGTFTLTDADEDTVGVTAQSSGAPDLVGNAETLSGVPDGFNIDTQSPVVSTGCISVSGDSGTAGAFKFGDFATPAWDNTAGCDNSGGANNDLVSVDFNASDFDSASSSLPGTDTLGVYTASTGLEAQDDLNNNVTVTVTDDAGNVTTVTGNNNYTIDTIVPSFDPVSPVLALTQADTATTSPTNLWYYYNTPAADFVKAKVTNFAESDGNQLAAVNMCIVSMDTDSPMTTCSTADFANPAKSAALTVVDGTTSTASYDLAGLSSWPTQQTGYVMNFQLVDDAGNIAESGPSENLIGIFNVNPKFEPLIPDLNNATTTDFSDITDFTNIVGLTFNMNNGLVDYGRLTFTDPVNLTDQATVTALAAFASNVTVSNSVMRVDSSAIAALNIGATLMMRTGTATQPALTVKDNVGVVIDTIPATAGPLDSYLLSGGHGTASNFVWDAVQQTLTFDVTGFSEYDTDMIMESHTPADGATGIGIGSAITINFSQPVNTLTFAFTDSSGITYSAPVWTNGNKTVTLSHSGNWNNSSPVTITVTTANNMAGNALTGTNSFSFTTLAASSGGGGGGGGGSGGSAMYGRTSCTGLSCPSATGQNVPASEKPAVTTTPAQTPFFTDTASHWAASYIDQLHLAGVDGYIDANGQPLHLFIPENQITRAELIVMLMKVKYGTLNPVTVAPYGDVPASHWSAPYVAKAKALGVVSGYSDGNFHPNANASRSEALKMILLTWVTPAQVEAAAVSTACSDVSQKEWYAQYFNYALAKGVVSGYKDAAGNPTGLCGPASNVTRAESAKMIVVTKAL